MFIQKNKKGYWEAWEKVGGKRRFIKYIGKDPTLYYASLEKGREILEAIKRYPDLAMKGSGQVILAEYKRRILEKHKVSEKLYKTIVIDPPWPMEKITRDVRPNQFDFGYPVMSIEEIKTYSLPINPSGCHIYLWTTQKFLPYAFEIMEGWGINYQCLMTWVKNVGFTPFSWMYSTEQTKS